MRLPSYGADWFTYDWGTRSVPNRIWRRYGHDRLVRMVLRVVGEYRLAHPEAPRVGIADLSRTRGGSFGRRYGGLGHASHQNGLDVDVLYPRLDGEETSPDRVRQIDRALAQDLVNRFVAAGAQKVYVGLEDQAARQARSGDTAAQPRRPPARPDQAAQRRALTRAPS